jgi:opacity protein-like surface antigen
MKKLMILLAAGAFVAAAPAFAADNTQQDKMKACNASAGDKKGDERKAYMSTCLSAKPAAAPAKPESKMAMCNKKTAGLDKDARAKAQSECMKAPA